MTIDKNQIKEYEGMTRQELLDLEDHLFVRENTLGEDNLVERDLLLQMIAQYGREQIRA